MDESEENMSAEDTQNVDSPVSVKTKPKKRSLVERELETNLTARVTSPVTSEGSSTSRYGRARKLKTAADLEAEKIMKPLKIDVSKQPQAYKMHASNSPISKESPKKTISMGSSIEDQIENIYNENIALSRFGSEEKAKLQSPAKKFSKIYIRKDLIQKPDNDTVVLIKNMFSSPKTSSHLNNILERSSEKYTLNGHGKSWNGIPDNSSVVKTLDFDGKKKKKDDDKKKEKVISKNELFDIEASCEYQVGDLAWARVGTYPFWPCIVTREPFSDMFVKKKLFGRVEHSVVHVTFFGDNGRRGWIVDNMLRKYHGRAEFESSRDKFTPEAKKKDPRLYAAYFVSEKKLPLWNVSVDEAETLMKEPKRLRIDILYDMLEKARASKTTPKREKGGKISRTDSDVSLSESLYDTLFSEDDGKTDENCRSKKARNMSLDVSEVVTACLDNMAAKSGIIQIQRQSHMDRWLQKAKSKTPEKMQPKLHFKVEKEKRKDRVKKRSKEGKKKMRKNESLGADANLLPHQNEHDYSSVNYENHNINDSSNKNADSASGLDSTLDTSDIGVVVKIESLSSSMDDLSQDDIITTVVSDDIIMTDPENISNDDGQIEINHKDNISDTVVNNNEPIPDSSKLHENEEIAIKEEITVNNNISNTGQPRRSKRKRQTFEGLNNSITENKAKEPKLDVTEPEANINIKLTSDTKTESNGILEKTLDGNKDCDSTGNSEIRVNETIVSKQAIDKTQYNTQKSTENTLNINSKPVVVIERICGNTEKSEIDSNEPKLPIETTQHGNPELLQLTRLSGRAKDKLDNKKGMSDPEFIKYLEIRQDTILDDQPDLTQDEVVTYLYQNWLYEEGNKTEMKKNHDSGQSNLVKGCNQEPMPQPKKNKKKTRPDNPLKCKNVDIRNMMQKGKLKPVSDQPKSQTKTLKNCVNESNKETLLKEGKTPCKIVKNKTQGSKDTQSITISKVNDVEDIKSIELATFNTSSKPVVVIEQLNLNRLETQLILKGSKQLIQNKSLDNVPKNDKNAQDNLGIPDVDQIKAVNDAVKDAEKTSQEISYDDSSQKLTTKPDSDTEILSSEVTKQAQDDNSIADPQQFEKDLNYAGSNEVGVCATPVILEENKKNTMNPVTDPNTLVSLETETIKVPNEPLIHKKDGILATKSVTNVLIGEETYTFDRTLSQDYDEIDAGEYDDVSDIPIDSTHVESEDTNVTQSDTVAHEKTLSTESKDVSKTSDLKSPEDKDTSRYVNSTEAYLSSKVDVSTNDDCGSTNKPPPDVPEGSSNLHSNCSFLDKESIHNESKPVPIDDNRFQTLASEVSNIINDEQNKSNQVTEENNAKCVFLDQNLEIANAQSSDSIEKKGKSPRLSLNRSRKPVLKLNKVDNDFPTLDYSHNTLNTNPETCVLETDSNYSNDSETSVAKRIGRTKDKLDPKEGMNDPDFMKYLEIRQDALLDEQPDLTQDEIVTYLYKNWLYEEGNKSEMKKIDDNEQSNLVKGQVQIPQLKKIKKKPKVESALESKKVDIRDMMTKEKHNPGSESRDESESQSKPLTNEPNKHPEKGKTPSENVKNVPKSKETKSISVNKLHDTEHTKLPAINKCSPDSNSPKENTVSLESTSSDDIAIRAETKSDAGGNHAKVGDAENSAENVRSSVKNENSSQEYDSCKQENMDVDSDYSTINMESVNIEETCTGKLENSNKNVDNKSKEHLSKTNGFIVTEQVSSKSNDLFDPETASIKSEDSGVSVITRKSRTERQDMKKSMEDPEFLKYLEARQDALIDEQPDLTQEEIVTYLYKTWFYEESQKSEVKKSDDNEQSNLVKGLNQEPAPQPRKYKKKPKVEKEIKVEKEHVEKVLKNADIRDMVQKEKPKRKATESKPYYNEDDSDLEEEDLETFKIFDRDEQNEEGEEIDEVELYFEQLTKPKPNVFKGYPRERVCEICDHVGNLVKCKSCHGTFHVECVKKEAEVIEVAAPTRGRKKKRGRKPKNYDPLLDSESQSDERSQDANNSEELNISIEDEAESHIVIDADNFETQWEDKLKELQTENGDEYASDQEINWEVEPGHCEIVDLKQKEKPIDYSDYKCRNCQKHDTPICFVCKSNKSPKSGTEVRRKCQVAHCHRYYHMECLDHWPQTQFNSWEPSKTNKKIIEYIEALSCPRHVCHTCVSDDPRGCKTRFCGDKLARCVKCPATYHSYTRCLPAGTQILTGSQIICPRHYEHRPGKIPCHVNTGWCFICALGGTLICCEYCPTSFHAECLNIKPPEGSYMCEDCETGRLPLYGEMVWVKLGHYRWWPGIVLHPTEIPDNIMAVKHSPGEFVVRFFGQYDHYWVNRGRVFPFQEGDSGRISSQKSKIDAAFTTAMEHAQRACEILKKMEPNQEEDLDIASSLLPPHYVKLKVNKPVGSVVRRDMDANSLTQCDCDPAQPDPCGPYSHCLNRMLLTECGPLCRAGERCNNRAFERRLYPRLQAYRTPQRGWGLRALEDIRQGQFVIEYVGELIDMEEFRRRMCRKHEIRDENFYFLTLDKERMIDAGPKGNLARFMNHCCEPNCETQKWTVLGDVRVGLFALRDIPANSEVTFNYNLECAGIEKKRCLCGAKRCSGYIGAKPKQLQDDQPKKTKPATKRTYKKRKPVEDTSKPKPPKIKIKPIKPRELTEIEKDLLIIKSATNGMSSDSEGSRVSVDDKNPKALKRKRVSFSTDDGFAKKPKMADSEEAA